MKYEYYDVNDIKRIFKCKDNKAYQIIKELNEELARSGSKIYKGHIPANFFHERYKGFKDEKLKFEK